MIYLITGSLGAGKTSNTLWYLLNEPTFKGRPKFASYIPEFDYEKHDFEQIDKNDLENWCYLENPDDPFSTVSNFEKGSILFFDEADLFFPASIQEKNPPFWLREMARSRHHGIDFYIITQQSKLITSFLYGLLQTHIHYHRPNGSDTVTRYSWEFHQPNVNSRVNRISGLPQKVEVNDQIFTLYRSTLENTRKKTPPYHIYKKLALFLLPMLLAPLFLWWFLYYRHLPPEQALEPVPTAQKTQLTQTDATPIKTSPAPKTDNGVDVGLLNGTGGGGAALTAKDFVPSDPVLPWTAPAYQDLAKPTDFPRIAMCISSNPTTNPEISHKFRDGQCRCFTQQYTPVDVPQNACLKMVKDGWFDNWATGRSQSDNVLTGKPDEAAARQAQNSKNG